ncbi:CHAP domain-containing protein [Ruminococcus albus]|uniref:CHAP domain-containing protein n=1 Tax=Ruminococcus albus TaxID=1264 RepID=A0A1H7NGJ5_RUMAL|nr:CHAP domain-containing protein [Ruminococcus albus]SEL22125.1 CHAP domain-containing protein [Ruminococcus albus]
MSIKFKGNSGFIKLIASFSAAVLLSTGVVTPSASDGIIKNLCVPTTITASAASNLYVPNLNGSNRIVWKATSWVPVYAYSNLSARGNFSNLNGSGVKTYSTACIDAGDDCYIYRMGNSVSTVFYPAGNTYKYAYVRTSDITRGNRNETRNAFKAAAGVNTFTYNSNGGTFNIGSIDKNDTCYLLNKVNNAYQLIYPISGGNYKIGWVSASDYARLTNSGGGSISNARQNVVNTALREVGVAETGNNNVKYNTWYYGRTINATGYAWCDAFVSWVANRSGVSTSIIPKSASVSNTLKFYRNCGRFYKSRYYGGSYTPKGGDLVFYGTNGGCHIGIIIASPVNGYLQVVEGNVLLNGKYQVAKFTANSKRTVNSSYVYGYASPNY